MPYDDENPMGGAGLGEFTLESILAEYKGSAFIDGDKKTPKEYLNQEADRIISEATRVPRKRAPWRMGLKKVS